MLLLAPTKVVLGYQSAWIEVNWFYDLNSCQTVRAEGQRYAVWPSYGKATLRYT